MRALGRRPYFTLSLLRELITLREAYKADSVSTKAPLVLGIGHSVTAALGTFVILYFAQRCGVGGRYFVGLILGLIVAFFVE